MLISIVKEQSQGAILKSIPKYSSSLMGLARLILIEIVKLTRTINRMLRLSLKATRFYFSGCSKAFLDMQLVTEYGGHLLLTYYVLRDDKVDHRRSYLRRNRVDKILLDSGGFSIYNALQKGQTPKPIVLEAYADFIKRHQDVIEGAFSLDVIGDPVQSKKNAEYDFNGR